MQNALVTLSIDLPESECRSHAVFRAYAEKFGLQFEVIGSPKYRIRPNWFRKRRVWYHIEKFQLYDLLQQYERIVFLDTDILIQAGCPNLLESVPVGRLGCVYDDEGPDAWKRREELVRLARSLGPLPGSGWRYFNSGVMVLDRSHRKLFEMDRRCFRRGRWPEQTLLNYRVIREGMPIHVLDAEYNFMPGANPSWGDERRRMQAHIVHYAGPEAKSVMDHDINRVLEQWGLNQQGGGNA